MRHSRLPIISLLLFALLVLINGLLGNVIATWLEPLLKPYKWYIIALFFVVAALLIGYELRDKLLGTSGEENSPPESEARNRQAMVEKVRAQWIEGVLKHSLYREVLIAVGLEERPDAVVRPLDVLVRTPDKPDRSLRADETVTEVFDRMAGTLLILGAPGAGKTTLLLELARDLLERAQGNGAQPIPVVFPLATWGENRHSLTRWLADELRKRYYVPQKLAQRWVETNQILPLLDGLDEVEHEHRSACVKAINAFWQQRGLLPLVVCCREEEYEALPERLGLQGAIVVQPLKLQEIETFLSRAGKRLAGVRKALRVDPVLRELLDTPLMLTIVALAYEGTPFEALQIGGTAETHRKHLFAVYIDRMFRRRGVEIRYSPEQTIYWLKWLAWQMRNHNHIQFYIERLQPTWLPKNQQWIPPLVTALVAALLFASAGVTIGWGFSGLVGPLVSGLLFGLFGGWLAYEPEIETVDALRWSWQEVRSNGRLTLVSAAIMGLIGGLAGALVFGLNSAPRFGVTSIVVFMLIAVMLHGLVSNEIEETAVPNEGIRRSARNALWFGLAGTIYAGLVSSLWGAPMSVLYGLLLGGIMFSLNYGGITVLQHTVLRLLLFFNGFVPWNYADFLDYATERIFLRRVGGSYIFIHRLLMEYFAEQYGESITENIA
jgi:DNA polymerase III delta prime subunit